MTPLAFATLVRKYTHTNTTTFPDAEMLPYANAFKDEIASQLEQRDAGHFDIPCVFNLVANQREYAIGDNLLNRLHKVEIKFSSSDARQPAQFTKDYLGSETESEIVKHYTNAEGEFFYTVRRRAIFILSGTISAVSNGVRTWSKIYPADFTDLTDNTTDMNTDPSTTTFGFPRGLHEILARRVSIAYKDNQPKKIPLSRHELKYEVDLNERLGEIASDPKGGEIVSDIEMPAEYNDGYNL